MQKIASSLGIIVFSSDFLFIQAAPLMQLQNRAYRALGFI